APGAKREPALWAVELRAGDPEIDERPVDLRNAKPVEHAAGIAEVGVLGDESLAATGESRARRIERGGILVETDDLRAGVEQRFRVPSGPERPVEKHLPRSGRQQVDRIAAQHGTVLE